MQRHTRQTTSEYCVQI